MSEEIVYSELFEEFAEPAIEESTTESLPTDVQSEEFELSEMF